MGSLVQLVSDTSDGQWRDYRHGFAVAPWRGNGSILSHNEHHVIWDFTAPAEWVENNQRAIISGHACYWAPNFTGRRPWHVWAQGGLSVGSAGVCGCSYEMTPVGSFPGSLGGTQRLVGIDFQIDVRFTTGAITRVLIRTNDTGNMTFINGNDAQSILWVFPVDDRSA